jgi:putative inorganic carbon (HCO3(-)) transporter
LGVSPNQLAGTILLFLPLTVVAAIRFWPKKRNNLLFIIAIISLVLTTFLLVLTQSRSGWIGAAAAVMAVVGLYIIALPPFKTRLFTRTRIITALIALTAVALLAISLVPSISQNMNSTIGELPKSSSYNFIFRQEVWRVGVDAAGDNYLTGVGLGSFRRVFTNDYESNISPEIDIAHAHNIFLQVLLDLGVPGLAAYLALLLISVNIGWNLISTYDPLKPLAISLLAGLFGFHIYSLTDTISLGSKTHFVFWLLMGILAGLPQMSKLASDEAEP